jgi:hypothetical protein
MYQAYLLLHLSLNIETTPFYKESHWYIGMAMARSQTENTARPAALVSLRAG